MTLRRTVRNLKTVGAKVTGIAEEIHNDLITVKIFGSGQRMTNLPLASQRVNVGDLVQISYATNGRPYVHAYTDVYYDDSASIEPALPWSEPRQLSTLDAVRVSSSVSIEFETDIIIGGMFGFSHKDFDPIFNTIEYDYNNMFDVENNGFKCQTDGRYLVHFVFAFSKPPKETGLDGFIRMGMIRKDEPGGMSSYYIGCLKLIRWTCADYPEEYVCGSASIITTVYRGEYIFPTITPQWGYAGIKLDEEGHEYWDVFKTRATFLSSPGRFPIMEMWKISDATRGGGEGERDWYLDNA